MQESIQTYAKTGLVHFMAYPSVIKGEGPVLETIGKILDDDYFDAIEVTWIKDEIVKSKARELLLGKGKTIGFGGQPPLLINKLSLADLDQKKRNIAVEISKNSIDTAWFLGAQSVTVLSGVFLGEDSKQKQTEVLLDSLRELCRYAVSKGNLMVLLESFDRSIGKNCLIGPTGEAIGIARKIRSEYSNFGLLLDLSHLPLLGETPEEMLIPAKDYLEHVHIGNCVMKDRNHPAYGDEHPVFGIPEGENGVEELAAFLKTLLEIGYLRKCKPKGVSFEVKPFGGQTTEDVIAGSKRTLDQAWRNI